MASFQRNKRQPPSPQTLIHQASTLFVFISPTRLITLSRAISQIQLLWIWMVSQPSVFQTESTNFSFSLSWSQVPPIKKYRLNLQLLISFLSLTVINPFFFCNKETMVCVSLSQRYLVKYPHVQLHKIHSLTHSLTQIRPIWPDRDAILVLFKQKFPFLLDCVDLANPSI